MPLDDEDLQKIQEIVKPLSEGLASQKADLENFKKDFPGMSKRHAGEVEQKLTGILDELKGQISTGSKGKEPAKPEGKEGGEDDRITKLENELKARDARDLETRKSEAITRALSQHKLVDGAFDDAKALMMGAIQSDKDGNLFIPSKKKLESTGEELPENVTVEEGVKRILSTKAYLLAASVAGGAGATGKGGGEKKSTENLTFRELLDDPVLMGRAIKENPDRVKELEAEHNSKKRVRA